MPSPPNEPSSPSRTHRDASSRPHGHSHDALDDIAHDIRTSPWRARAVAVAVLLLFAIPILVVALVRLADDDPRPEPTWSAEFDEPLDLAGPDEPGAWRTTDVWQDVGRGFRDFAGTSWNLNPNETAAYDPFTVDDGVLTIAVRRTPPTIRPTIAASMDEQGQDGAVPDWAGGYLVKDPAQQTFLHGYFEVRVRFRGVGPGMFPAVWLFATGGSTNPLDKGNAEIDILEIFGHPDGSQVTSTVHFRDNAGEPVHPSRTVATTTVDPEQWQTYGLDWQPDHLRFYVNGEMVGELTGAEAAWFDTPMSLRINYAMDAPWFPPERRSGPATPAELFMDVEYVRVYPTKP